MSEQGRDPHVYREFMRDDNKNLQIISRAIKRARSLAARFGCTASLIDFTTRSDLHACPCRGACTMIRLLKAGADFLKRSGDLSASANTSFDTILLIKK